MAVKAREERIADREIRRNARSSDRAIVDRPRWVEELARPPYKPRERRVAGVEQR